MDERIRKLRKALNLTQQEFADKLGIKRATVATYETGRNIPLDVVVESICSKFDVNETWLRTGEGPMFKEKTIDEELSEFFADVAMDEGFKKRFITALSRLNEDQWELLAEIAEAIRSEEKAIVEEKKDDE